jgi:hypothetical protein
MNIMRSPLMRVPIMRDERIEVTILPGIVKNIGFNTKSKNLMFKLKRYVGYNQ